MANTEPFKVGDPVAFEHMGMEKKGTIVELLDGKARVKDERGYMYRYASENISHAGNPIVRNPQVPSPQTAETKTNNTNQPTTMTKEATTKEPKAPKTPKAAEKSTADAATIQKIVALSGAKKHQRIFLLLDAGCTKEEVSEHGKCNFGEISNARKMYAESADKTAAAKALLV